jgi:hypothetical protein
VIAEAACGQVEDRVLSSLAKLRAQPLHREALLGGVRIGEAVVRTDDECVSLGIWQEHGGRIRREEIARRDHGVPETVPEVERPDHFVVGVM